MRRSLIILGLLFVGAVASVGFAVSRAGRGVSPAVRLARAETDYHRKVLPVLNKFCWDCHGDGATKGDLSLDAFTNAMAVVADRKVWEHVLQNVRSGDMPPAKKPQPTAEQRELVVNWIEHTLFPVDPRHPDPGRITLRRLNRVEYDNTIRDLLGVDFKASEDFPQDDVGYGFDNIGDVLSLPPILLEKYVRAAENILDEAIVSGPRPPRTRRFLPDQLTGHQGGGTLATLVTNGELSLLYTAPQDGEYIFKAKAYGDQAGPEKVKMAFRMDGRELEKFEVRRDSFSEARYFDHRLRLAAGQHRFAVAFLNDYYKEEGGGKKEKKIEDRNLQVVHVEVVGPYTDEPPPITDAHRWIFFRPHDAKNEAAVSREIIEHFARRAFRRPVTREEIDGLAGLFRAARSDGDNFEAAVQQALTAVLVSPHFLFRGELQAEPDNPRSVHAVNEHALASRLSYFLWSSLPDEQLSRLADQERLRKNLSAQIRRMLADPKARALTDNFAGQWLQLRTMGVVAPDEQKFPDFNPAVRVAMRTETEKLFEYVVSADRPVTEMVTADYTFLNGALAKYYGIAGVSGDDFVKVSLAGSPRRGILGQGSFLTLTSNPTRTSPVKRGKWVLDNLLGMPPPPAPPGVPPLKEQDLQGTLRQRMEQHRDNPMCASCHARMDPIGFAFEHFDGAGRFREKDGGAPVETSGQLATGEKVADHLEMVRLVAEVRRADYLRCLTEKLLTYALGRGLDYYDRPAVEEIQRKLIRGELHFSALVQGVVESVPFQMRRGDGDPNQVAVVP